MTGRRPGPWAVLLLAVLVGGVAQAWAWRLDVPVVPAVLNTQFAHYFIAGMALFMLYRFGLTVQIALLVPICLGNAVYRAIGYAEAVGERYSVTYSPVVITAVVVLIFLVMTFVSLRVTSVLARPWLVTAGALTYPLYLLHAHVGFILFARLEDAVNKYVLLVAMIAVMLGAAYLVHRFVERPLAPRLKRLLSKREPPAHAVVPAGSPTA